MERKIDMSAEDRADLSERALQQIADALGCRRDVGEMLSVIAVLKRSRDEVLEEAAGVADEKVHHTLPVSDRDWNNACQSVAAGIRALKVEV